MTHTNKQFIAQQKEQLLERRSNLLEDLRSFAHKNPDIPDDWETNFPQIGNDEDENTQEITEYINDLPVEYTLELELRKVNRALRMIQEERYGVCENCDATITKERLTAYPEAELCLACADNDSS